MSAYGLPHLWQRFWKIPGCKDNSLRSSHWQLRKSTFQLSNQESGLLRELECKFQTIFFLGQFDFWYPFLMIYASPAFTVFDCAFTGWLCRREVQYCRYLMALSSRMMMGRFDSCADHVPWSVRVLYTPPQNTGICCHHLPGQVKVWRSPIPGQGWRSARQGKALSG